jgi:hypothetical protein
VAHLIIGNASGRTIEKVTFTFAARYPGRSSDLANYNSYYDDHIIAPNEGWGGCYALPALSEKLMTRASWSGASDPNPSHSDRRRNLVGDQRCIVWCSPKKSPALRTDGAKSLD